MNKDRNVNVYEDSRRDYSKQGDIKHCAYAPGGYDCGRISGSRSIIGYMNRCSKCKYYPDVKEELNRA